MRVIRLTKRAHASALDGKGAAITGGRWNSVGKPVIYAASCGALAAFEYLAHADKSVFPASLVFLTIDVPDLPIERVHTPPVDVTASRQIGDDWLASNSTILLEVPSVLIPKQKNYLLNPNHPLFPAVRIVEINPFAFDSRLLSAIPPAP